MKLVVSFLLFWSFYTYSCQLRLGADGYFPPHLNPTESGWQGLSIDLIQTLADEVGCELTILQSPWRRSLQLIAQGQLDVVTHLSVSAERMSDFIFIGPHHMETVVLIGDPSKVPPVQTLAELANWPLHSMIAILNGAYYGEEFHQLIEQDAFSPTLVEIRSHEDKLALLDSGRVQAVLEDQTTLYHWQQQGLMQDRNYQQLMVIYNNPVYFGFSRHTTSPQLQQQLSQAW
ncbi:transporter substrate-binding domain-containing protein [Alkalimonas collagenimarina]|uniref:Transporter substrate-binding domain-containing protein n=1 Tax=Alkalimonas collagenimarina TaxID=400390 RepID=A0ABT9GWT1_9GAMM|nr:transporter substrate-binding domain-containing protein [Alkalimonas collagenimarina]MDP4535517.1 transporter substrate-binding domain-containing protein [Alkalimonas collagenimarina]